MQSNCGMDEIIENTVQFRFPLGSPRPTWSEIADFLKTLDTDLLSMETAYRTSRDRSISIKFVSLEAMTEALKKNTEAKKFHYTSGRTTEVRMTVAGSNIRYIRLFDLPPELKDETISLALGEYGRVEQIIREKFPAELGLPHLCTGVRGIYMTVEKDIPPMINFGGREGRIYYDGLQDTCFSCREVGHRRDSCPHRQTNPYAEKQKKEKKKQRISQPTTYAAVVSGQELLPTEQEEELPVEIIEVLEDDIIEQTSEMCDAEELSEVGNEMNRKGDENTSKDEVNESQDTSANARVAQRRAQFAASGCCTSSGSVPRPRKKCARMQFY